MKTNTARWAVLILLALVAPAFGQVVINEIMYKPYSERESEEYIELYNNSNFATNVTGWQFTKGISYSFTNAGASIPAHGYLVVVANSQAFFAKYGNEFGNVYGNWVGTLRNGGERIELQDAIGNVISSVHYSKGGDWGVRLRGSGEDKPMSITRSGSAAVVTMLANVISGDSFVMSGADQSEYNGSFSVSSPSASVPNAITSFNYPISGTPASPATGYLVFRQISDCGHVGWSWSSRAAGLGSSLELVNAGMPNESGQNWRASAVVEGTPGAANSVSQANIAPLIMEARHYPLVPQSTTPVSVTARVLDENPGFTVTLYWRVDANPVNLWQSTTMFDDGEHNDGLAGDGLYGANLAARPHSTVVEFYILARDVEGNARTWPAPALDQNNNPIQEANALYQVDDLGFSGTDPSYRIIMREAERAELQTFPDNDPAKWGDAGMNCTFVATDGEGTQLRYLCEVRDRGAGTRGNQPCNYKISFPADQPYGGVDAFNLNTRFTESQMLGYVLSLQAGLPTEWGRLVKVRVNNVDRTSQVSPQFGHYMQLQGTDGDYAKTHWPNDPDGNVYRCQSWGHDTELAYLGTNWLSYAGAGYIKQSNQGENDYTDLVRLTEVLNNTPDGSYVQSVLQVADVDEWMLYFAMFSMTLSRETSLATGTGDDYSMYRGINDTRFKLLAHDWDTILNQGDTHTGADDLFRMTTLPSLNRFMKHPAFVPIYFQHLKRLGDTIFYPTNINRTIDFALTGITPKATNELIKAFASNRWFYVMTHIPTNLTVSGPSSTTSASASLSGQANVIDTRSVLVNGNPATWSAWQGTWSGTVSLLPGINRVLVQSLNSNGVEFARATLDVYYNDSTTTDVSGAVSGSNYWAAANGPYNVTGSLTIGNNATVVIEAGTTVYIAAGASITVSGSGRLFAEGTDRQHIRFTRYPNGNNWGALDFVAAITESRLAYVDIDYCGGTTVNGHNAEVHVNSGSKVFFDHLTFTSSPVVQYISFEGSSFIVQNCYFPTYPGPSGPEMLHGSGGIPAGGYGIFRDNYFGHTWQANDTIDFTGGNRPGPILQIIGNVFDGASDDHLDLDSTDAWIEGNIFMHAHRDINSTSDSRDTASAISGGTDSTGVYSEWTILNNLFYDMDHAVLAKQGARFTFVNNTVVHINKGSGGGLTNDIAAFDFTDNGLALPDPTIGAGAYIAGNIIWDYPRLTANYDPSNHTVIFENNVLGSSWSGPGSNNVVADPQLNLSLITSVASADWKTVKAALQARSCSPALGAGLGGFDAGGYNPKGLLIFGEPSGITTERLAKLTVFPGGSFPWGTVLPYAWGYTNYKWKLDDGPWSAELSISQVNTIELDGLANGPHTVYVTGKNDAGYYQDSAFVYPTNGNVPAHVTASRTWIVTNIGTGLRINEVLASNDRAVLHGESYPDMIEIFNDTGATVSLSGMGISDEPQAPYKFIFPAGTVLTNGGYLVLFADDPDGTSGIHIGFKLNKDGGGVYLYDKGNRVLLDSVVYGMQVEDWSIGRINPDGHWGLTYPTLGRSNKAAPVGDPQRLKINEWLTTEVYAYSSDFIELYNPDPAPTCLGGLFLTDNVLGWPTRNRIAELSFIPASGYTVFRADGGVDQGANHLNFQLAHERGEIGLLGSNVAMIDYVFYGPQILDVSQGRSPSGGESIVFFNSPTPGGGNPGSSGNNYTVTNIVQNIVGWSNVWSYNCNNSDLGSAWYASNYNDTGWSSGRGLLYCGTGGPFPYGVNTSLPLTSGNLPWTVYFRTHFTFNGNTNGFSAVISHLTDDGSVYYLNGQELYRYNMPSPPNPISFTTPASGNINNDATMQGPSAIQLTNLFQGDNVLAVEVHQQNTGSADILMGVSLDLTRSETNYISYSVVLNEVLANSKTAVGTNVVPFDWVELYNPTGNAIDLSGMSMSDDSTQPRRWVVPAGVMLQQNEYLVVRFDGANPASTNNEPVLNTGFGLKGEGGRVFLFDALSRGAGQLDALTYGPQAADYSIGRVPDGTGFWCLTVPNPEGANIPSSLGDVQFLRINEWMAKDNNGPDWLELYNPNAQPVNISGLFLTDDLNDRTKSKIPALSFIGTGEYGFVQFMADSGTDPNHVGFKLAIEGDEIGLFPANGPAIDIVSFGAQDANVSQGRFPDGAATVMKFPGTSTPAAANLLPLTDVVINEVLTHTDPPFEDAIELYNTTLRSIDISGWYLTDNKNDPKRFRIPEHTVIQPGGFAVFYEYQFNPDASARPPYFALSGGHGDEVSLFSADAEGNLLGYRSDAKFGAAENGVSIGRYLSSIDYDFVALSQRTFGADNPATTNDFRMGTGLSNAYPKVGPVVINEIMYHPFGGTNGEVFEFIELRNISGAPVALYNPNTLTNTWRIRDGVDYDFPTNVSLPVNGSLLVVGFDPTVDITSLTNFCAFYGLPLDAPLYGPWRGKLANDSERVELYKPDDPEPAGDPDAGFVPYVLVERVHYSDSAPWPSGPDGTNTLAVSLQRRPGSLYGNDPINWYAGLATPCAGNGAAFGPTPVITSLTPSHIAGLGTNELFAVVATGGQLSYQWYFNGVPVPNAIYATFGIVNMQASKAGDYVVVISNPNGTTSGRLHVDVAQPPVIAGQPQNQYAALGGTAAFSASVLGSAPVSYQWQRDGTNLPGQTGLLLVINNVQASDQSIYRVVVTNIYGTATSAYATLTLSAAPAIVTQPVGTNVFVGASVTFNVLASGTGPLRYQWRKDGLNIGNATNASLTLTNVGLSDSGSYTAYVSNRVGSVLSSAAVLTVIVPPTVSVVAMNTPVSEAANWGIFMISRSGSTAVPLTVNFTISGNATPGQDYAALSGPITIAAGATSTNVFVVPVNDAVPEGDETVTLTLSPAYDYALSASSNATVTIHDDDNQAPLTTLTSPAPGLLGNEPMTVVLAATASDSDGNVAKVVFYSNETNKLGELTTPPYTLSWSNVSAGDYLLRAVATDNLGSSGSSVPVSISINALPVVSITNPVQNASFYLTTPINIAANASDRDGSVTQVQFFNGSTLLGTVTSAPFSMTWSNGVVGSFALTAVATDNRGTTKTSAPVNINILPPAVTFTDNFRDRPHLSGFTNYIIGSNNMWTKEPGERNHADAQGGHSGWISWTAPASGQCVVQTTTTGLVGVSGTFDTVLAVYTGQSLTNLMWVASNDDMTNSSSLQSFVSFYAVSGMSYEIALDGWVGSSVGTFYFRMGITNPFPVIVTPPVSQSVAQGAAVTFTVTASGAGPLSYQWQFNNNNIEGATGASFVIPSCQSSNEGAYRVIVSNSSGSVPSTEATLTVRVPATFVMHPQDQLVSPGESAAFSVSVTGSLPMTYQWRLNTTNIVGATNATYSCPNVHYTNAGLYSVRIINPGGLVFSQNGELNVRPRFVASHMQPDGVFLVNGEGVVGKTYAVDCATTFTNWTSLGTISNTAIQMQLPDSNTVATPKFYRFRQTP